MLYNSETKGFGLYYIIIQNKNVQEKLYELLVAEHMSSSVKLVALQGTFVTVVFVSSSRLQLAKVLLLIFTSLIVKTVLSLLPFYFIALHSSVEYPVGMEHFIGWGRDVSKLVN